MSQTKFYVKQGLVQKAKGKILGGFDLNRFVKWFLDIIHVPYHDECCNEDATTFPVRYNSEGSFEYFNGTAWVAGAVTSGDLVATYIPVVAGDSITAGTGGAISVATYYTGLATDAGGDAYTLANGVSGQMKVIRLVTDGGGDAVITPANLAGGTTITLNDAGDEVTLVFDGTDWVVIKNIGATVA